MFNFGRKEGTHQIRNSGEIHSVKIASVEWRDGQQSLLATRIHTADMLPILDVMDQVGFDSMEMWGGATFDVSMRYLLEDPWERAHAFRQICSRTPLRMLLRGQNLIGYKQYPDDVVEKFVELSCRAGIDKFLIFDGLNDVRNTEIPIKAVIKNGKTAEANICYTLSPVHTLESYVDIARQFESLGVSAIHIEDMAGMMTPTQVSKAVSAIKSAVKVPIHFHAHSTGGMADVCYWEAIKAGAMAVDCCVSSLSQGPAHPPTESIVIMLSDTPFKTNIDMDKLCQVNDYFKQLRIKYAQFATTMTGIDISVLRHQIPGGMLSNLESQLKAMKAEDRMDEVFKEVYEVRKDLGYPPLATPFAQMVGAQATTNVLLGERYKMISKDIKNYIHGHYGRPTGEILPLLKEKVLGSGKPVSVRPGSLLKPEWDEAVKNAPFFARTEEDIMSYILFPDAAEVFLKKKYGM